MEITIEQIKTFSPETTQVINNLLVQLNPASRTLNDENVKKIIEEKCNCLLVARETTGNRIIGMLTLITSVSPSVEKGFIEDVVVDEKYRGKGVGEKLMTRALDQAREKGITYVDLTSNPTRIAANKLYQQLGFKKRDTNVYRMEIR